MNYLSSDYFAKINELQTKYYGSINIDLIHSGQEVKKGEKYWIGNELIGKF